MWLIDVYGGWGAIVGLGVQSRWETGLELSLGSGLGLELGLRELEEKWRKKEKKTKKIQQKEKMFLFDSK